MQKTIKECYEEYMDYCKSIGQRKRTLNSKEKFCKYELVIIVNLDDSINTITKDKIQKHINYMIDKGYKGNYYQTYVIKIRAFLTYCFTREYLEKFEVKIPNIILAKKEVYTEAEINKLLKKPNLNTCLVGNYRSWTTVNFLLGTGCRSTTLLNVKVKDIDFLNESILFRYMKTKNQVTVILSKTLKVVLREYNLSFSFLIGCVNYMSHPYDNNIIATYDTNVALIIKSLIIKTKKLYSYSQHI